MLSAGGTCVIKSLHNFVPNIFKRLTLEVECRNSCWLSCKVSILASDLKRNWNEWGKKVVILPNIRCPENPFSRSLVLTGVNRHGALLLTILCERVRKKYEGWNFNSGNYLFTTDTK